MQIELQQQMHEFNCYYNLVFELSVVYIPLLENNWFNS